MKPLTKKKSYITEKDLEKIQVVTAYSRVSTEEQSKGYSIDAQIAFLEDWAKREAWKLYKPNRNKMYYSDPGFSGKNIERPGIQELLEDAEAKKDRKHLFQAVLVYHNDRLSRDVSDTLYIVDHLRTQRIRLLLGNLPGIDLWTPEGRMVLTQMAGTVEYVRRDIGRKTSFGMQQKRSRGHWCGRIPFGFQIEYIEQGGDTIPTQLILEDEEFKILMELAVLRKHKKTYREIAADLNKRKLYRRKNAKWYVGTVQRSYRYYQMWMKEQRDKM